MSAVPNYAGTPKSPTITISTANTNRDGTGTLGTLMTAGASGSRVDRVRIQATGTTTAGTVRLFIGAALIHEQPVLAITPSATTPAWAVDVDFPNGLILEAAVVLKAGTEKAESFALTVINGGDF